MRRTATIAVTTAVALAGVTGSLLPTEDRGTPAGQQRELQREYREAHRRQVEETRLRGNRAGEAIARDKLRSAEHRPPPDAAKVARGMLRRRLP